MIALALALAAQQPASNPPVLITDAHFCEMTTRNVRLTREEYPHMADALTRIDSVAIDCPSRTVTWNKTFIVPRPQTTADWRALKQEQFNRNICDNGANGPIARRGWRFVTIWTFASGERVTIEAHC